MQEIFSSPTALISALGGIILVLTFLGFMGEHPIEGFTAGLGIAGILALVAAPLSYWVARDGVGAVCLASSGAIALGFTYGLCRTLRKTKG